MLKDCVSFTQEADTGGGKSFKTKNDIVFGTPIGATRLHEAESYALLAVSVADHAKIFVLKFLVPRWCHELEARPVDLAFLYVLHRVNCSGRVCFFKPQIISLLRRKGQKSCVSVAESVP